MKKYLAVILIPLLLPCATAVAADFSRACTEMGCTDGLTINVPQDFQWKPGAYKFSFVLDGKPAACTGNLPLKPCDSKSLTCDQEGITIMESGCALPADMQGFGTVTLPSAPRQVSVTVERDGTTLFSHAFTPTYQDVRPNGPQCDPACHTATVDLFPGRDGQ